jgi:hypothetical protein
MADISQSSLGARLPLRPALSPKASDQAVALLFLDGRQLFRPGSSSHRFLSFPKAHRMQIHSTNPLERLNAEVKRRTDVAGIFPNNAAITRLVGALLLEQNDEWQLQRRYKQLEGLRVLSDIQLARLSAIVN